MGTYTVTGGAGFIGSHLVSALLAAGHDVTILDDLSTGKAENLTEGIRLLRADIAATAAVREALAGTDGCFHLAAIPSVQRSSDAWLESHRTNQGGSIAVFEAARVNGKIPVVYASSAAVYGNTGGVAAAEERQPTPLTAYGVDKYGSELHASVGWRVHGLSSFGCRLFNVYGPRQNSSSPCGGVVSAFIRRVAMGETLLINGDGHQVRDFIHVSDSIAQLIAAMRLLCSAPGSYVANVCGGRGTTVLELAQQVMKAMGRTVPVCHGPARPGDIHYSVGRTERSAQLLGTVARIELAEGLNAMVDVTDRMPMP